MGRVNIEVEFLGLHKHWIECKAALSCKIVVHYLADDGVPTRHEFSHAFVIAPFPRHTDFASVARAIGRKANVDPQDIEVELKLQFHIAVLELEERLQKDRCLWTVADFAEIIFL